MSQIRKLSELERMSKAHKSLVEFTAHPWKSMVLAALLALIGAVVVFDWIPGSANRVYFPGHKWVLASLCWVTAAFFLFCAVRGSGSAAGDKRVPTDTGH